MLSDVRGTKCLYILYNKTYIERGNFKFVVKIGSLVEWREREMWKQNSRNMKESKSRRIKIWINFKLRKVGARK